MRDRTDKSDWPNMQGPWHEVTDIGRVFDHGALWCIYAAGHPDREGGYPDPLIHVPPWECRTAGLTLRDIRDELLGDRLGLEIYAAKPFVYGEPRDAHDDAETRIVFETFDQADTSSIRFSAPLGDSLRIAQHLRRLVTTLDHPPAR